MADDQRENKRCRWGTLALGFIAGLAVVLGFGAATRATDQAAFCANCHAMAEAAWTHKQSVHAREDCNACHLPPQPVARLPMKASTGIHDFVANTANTVPPLIQASPGMKKVINDNCIRCHAATVGTVNMTGKEYCTDCHKAVPHMKKLPVSERRAGDV
jgi:cytochrome c nitrite reductase small subunit